MEVGVFFLLLSFSLPVLVLSDVFGLIRSSLFLLLVLLLLPCDFCCSDCGVLVPDDLAPAAAPESAGLGDEISSKGDVMLLDDGLSSPLLPPPLLLPQ